MSSSEAKKLSDRMNGGSAAEKDRAVLGNQFTFPKDLLSSKSHSGLCVLFEINKLKSAKAGEYVRRFAGIDSTRLKRTASDSLEVAMQNDRDPVANASIRSEVGGYERTGLSIVLPPPSQWTETLSVMWSSTELGAIGRAGDLIESVVDLEVQTAASQVFAGLPRALAAMSGAEGAKQFMNVLTGISQNNYSEVLFNSVNNRIIPFVLNLIPRNETEAELLRLIIHRFKYAALPSIWSEDSTNASYFRAPFTFDISFVTVDGNSQKWWTKIGTCALTNITINKTPNGEFSVIKDSSGQIVPQAVALELQFMELTRLVQDGLEDPDNSY